MAITRTDRDQVFGPNGLISEAIVERDVTIEVNATAVRTQLAAALANLQAIIDAAATPATVTNVAQAQTAIRQLQQAVGTMARNQRRLVRHALAIFDGAD